MDVVLVVKIDRPSSEDATEFEPVGIFENTDLAVQYLERIFPLYPHQTSVDMTYRTNGVTTFANYPFKGKFVLEFKITYRFMKPSYHYYLFLETKVLNESTLSVSQP
jgi:hypothetical protein